MSVDPFLSKVEKIYTFIVHLAVVLGGLISLAWLAGSLLLYWKLDRPVWELASLVAVSLFVFSWFCVREFSRRSLRAGAGKPPDDDSWGEDREGLEDHLAEIEEGLSEARRGGKKEMIQELEEAREGILSQLDGLELEGKVEELQRLRDEASAAGRGSEAGEYSKKIDKHEARLKERGERLEDLPTFTRLFAYGMLASFILSIAFFFLLAPLVMLMITGFFWEAWADGSEWLRSPGGMLAVIAASLVLACVGGRIVSWHFSSEASGIGKESLWAKRSR
ncbi:MAG TPA: hypothetical protein DD471_02720 [Planctomycetes bacterium]|nr:hypothetical protein [Planctomycetota bacterium]